MKNDKVFYKPKASLPSHIPQEAVMKIAWPLFKLHAYTPRRRNQQLDGLQRLYLNIHKKKHNNLSILDNYLGFDQKLIEQVRDRCINERLIDNRGVMTELGKKYLEDDEKEELADERMERIILYRDGISGEIIPYFEREELRGYVPENELIEYLPVLQPYKKPRPPEIIHGLRLRNKLLAYISGVKEDTPNVHQVINIPPDLMEQVDWDQIDDEGEYKDSDEHVVSIPSNSDKKRDTELRSIRIDDQKAEMVYIETFLYMDPDEPNEWFVQSPFNAGDESWYGRALGRAFQFSNDIKELVSVFQSEVQDLFDINLLKIQENQFELINDIPKLSTFEGLQDTRREVKSFELAKRRLNENLDDLDTYFMRAQRVVEAVLDACILLIDDRRSVVSLASNIDFRHHLGQISCGLNINLPSSFQKQVYREKMKKAAELRGQGVRERALVLVMDAYYGKNSNSLSIFEEEPDLLELIDFIIVQRNQLAHHNSANMNTVSLMQVEKGYDVIRTILQVLLKYFHRGDSDV